MKTQSCLKNPYALSRESDKQEGLWKLFAEAREDQSTGEIRRIVAEVEDIIRGPPTKSIEEEPMTDFLEKGESSDC
jgi:hypothetical protein